MKQWQRLMRRTVLGLACGATILQINSCTLDTVLEQSARGATTALTGIFSVVVTDVVNDFFGVV